MTGKAVISKIRKSEKQLRTEFHVRSLYIFGSVARGEASKKSDIDILVEFESPNEVGLFEFSRLKTFLETILKARVDLVTRDALNSEVLETVEKDLVRAA